MTDPRLKALFMDALDQPAEHRETFIRESCDDAELCRHALELLSAHEDAGDFLSTPAAAPFVPPVPIEDVMPESIGGRRVIRKLGEGGFGIVYLAQQDAPVRAQVAVKVVRPGMGSRQVLARFETERRALELMKHPCIAGVLDAGTTDDGRPYFVLEHVEGDSITAFSESAGLRLRERIELFEQVCYAVQHAHQKGVIHRDIKPSNVLVTEVDGKPVPKIIDFGIAKAVRGPLTDRTAITHSAQIVGTPQYMSPEQVTFGESEVDTRSDVYSLGALLYELLTGTPPFELSRLQGAGAAELERIVREENPSKPSTRVLKGPTSTQDGARTARELRGDMDWITARALEKDPARRYQTPAALAADLRRYLDGEAVEAGPPSDLYRLRKLVSRYKIEVSAAAAVMMALVAVVVVSLVFASRAEHARLEAERELEKFQAISSFTEEMLSGIDPAVARGADTALFRSILDDAAERVSNEPPALADVEIELRTMIGMAYRSVALYEDAEEQIAAARTLALQELAADDPLALDLGGVLGQLMAETGRSEEALNLFTGVYELRAEHLGEDHPLTLSSLSNMGAALNSIGRYEEAVATHERVLEGRVRVLGDRHEDTMASRNNLASALDDVNRGDEAIVLLEEVLAFQTDTLGEDHPRTLATMNNIAFAYEDGGRWQEAEPIYERVLEIKRRVLPEGHPSIIITLNNLASLYGQHGQPARGVPILEEAVELSTEHSGATNIRTLTLQINLAANLMRLDRHDEARPRLEAAAAGFGETVGPTNPRTIMANSQLASLHAETGDPARSFEISDALIPAALEGLPPEHRILAGLYRVHAEALLALGRAGEALESAAEAQRIAKAAFGDGHPRTRDFLVLLRDVHAELGQAEEAAQWGARADSIPE